MNTLTECQARFPHPFAPACRAILILVFGVLLVSGATPLLAEDNANDYYQNMLVSPGRSVREAEARGRVTIYDGVENSQIERAMDTQFDRIDNMMFVRTRNTLPDGTVEEYDDCD
jgi:hypothetical protein